MGGEKGRHPQLLQAVIEINNDRRRQLIDRLREMVGGLAGKTVGLMGLSFKPNTDDLREAPALEIAGRLMDEGARVRAYDPVAMPRAAELLPQVEMAATAYDLAEGADALMVCT